MAEKKTNGSSGAKKNTGTKKAAASKKSQSSKSKTSKSKTAAEKQRARSEAELYIKKSRTTKGIVQLCTAALCILLYFIEGDKIWLSLHQCYWGLFGFTGIILPLINIYCAVQMFKEKSTYRFPLKVFFFCGTVVLFATMIFCFGSNGMELGDYGTELMNCFRKAAEGNGTGFIGGVLGIPLARTLGSVGSALITLVLLSFFVFMSFEALFMNIIERIKEPVNERISEHKEIKSKIREEETKIKAEKRRQAREEYVSKKVEQKLSADKRREAFDSDYRRIDKTPIYEPEPAEKADKKKKAKAIPETDDNAEQSVSSKKNSSTGIEGLIPDISPRRSKKKDEPAVTGDMEHINDDVFLTEDNIDISALVRQDAQTSDNNVQPDDNESDSGSYDDVINAVFGSDNKKKKGAKNPPPAKTAQPEAKQDDSKVAPSELSGFADIGTDGVEGYYLKPPFTLLEPQPDDEQENITQELHQSATTLVDTLKSFGVQTTIINISRGPSVTRYELQPASGVKISKITNLSDDIAMNLAATGVRIEAPIPGKNAVGIEVPNRNVTVVKMRNLVESKEFQNAKSKLTVALGMDITGKITLADLARMPHLLIAGSTGSGKSVCINSMLVSLLYKSDPDEVKLMLIDPKVVELGVYNGIPHLLVPVVTDPRKAAGALNWAVNEMLERYKTFAEYNVRDMHSYNRLVDKQNAEAEEAYTYDSERTFEEDEMLAQAQAEVKNSDEQPKEIHKLKKMCQIVIVIDELADLMMAAPNEVEESICRLAQMARAAGMHLVIATQRPSVDVITGLIKANVPSRIAFAVKSQIDSRTILDSGGAEKLLGRGDMLFSPIGTTKPIRVQGCFVDDNEIENIIEFIKGNKIVEYDPNVIDQIERSAIPENGGKQSDVSDGDTDPMMEQAIQCVVEAGQASTSLLQRRLRLGYARAGRLIDEMEQMGIVGPHEGSKPRQVLMTYQQWLERNMSTPPAE